MTWDRLRMSLMERIMENHLKDKKMISKECLIVINEFLFNLVERLSDRLLKVSSRRDKALSLAKSRDNIAKNLLETQFIADEEIRFLRGKVGELEKENSKLRLIVKSSAAISGPKPDASTVAKAILAHEIKRQLIIRSPQEQETKKEKKEWKRKRCPESVYMDFWDERTEIYYQNLLIECSQEESHKTMHWGTCDFPEVEGRFQWNKEGVTISSVLLPKGVLLHGVKTEPIRHCFASIWYQDGEVRSGDKLNLKMAGIQLTCERITGHEGEHRTTYNGQRFKWE